MILISDHTIKVVGRFLLNRQNVSFKRLLLDATGKVTVDISKKKPKLDAAGKVIGPLNEKKAMLHYVFIAAILKPGKKEECFIVPLGEIVTDGQTDENIGHFLRFVLSRLPSPAFNRLCQTGTDDSWANVHAIFSLHQE